MGASFHLSLTVFERNLGYLQKQWFFPTELCLNSGRGKFCFGVSIVDNTFNKIYIALNCKSCNKPLMLCGRSQHNKLHSRQNDAPPLNHRQSSSSVYSTFLVCIN